MANLMLTDNISVNILDVIRYTQSGGTTLTYPRSFSALSFRADSKSEFHFGEKTIRADLGSITFVPAGVEYERVTKHENALVFHFDMINNAAGEIEVFNVAHPETYKPLFEEALSLWEHREPGYKYRATAVFYEILAIMQRDDEINIVASHTTGAEKVAAFAKNYMDSHFPETSLSISGIAALAFVSETYLRRVFEKIYSISPKQYLLSIRVSRAQSLIEAGGSTQKEIAALCGFRDV